MIKKTRISKELLEDLYIKKKLTQTEIAKIVGKKQCTVSWYMSKFGIPTRITDGRFTKIGSTGDKNSRWSGGEFVTSWGYVRVLSPERKNSDGDGYILRSHVVAERAMGRLLRYGEVVHHINGIRDDDRNSNLLACTNSYHAMLHSRIRKIGIPLINYGPSIQP